MIVFWFGGESEGVSAAIRTLFRGQPVREVRVATRDDIILGDQFEGGLDAALDRFTRGAAPMVTVFGDAASRSIGAVHRPRFGDGVLEHWSGYAEGDDGLFPPSVLDDLLAIDGLSFCARFADEWPDLDVPRVTADTFPWEHWLLIVGCVRDPDGRWIVRPGPAADGNEPPPEKD
jgi:hypothetical protein